MQQQFHYFDPELGIRGWLVYDGEQAPLAVGGCRIQDGLTLRRLRTLAGRMTLKERVLGINADGAKCGIDLPFDSPVKAVALDRFLSFLHPHLDGRFSMGCDMGTSFAELERLAQQHGLRSVKHAVRRAQHLTEGEYEARLAVLEQHVGRLTVGERRAGHALAYAAIAGARHVGRGPHQTYAVQGFGTLGRATAYSLNEAGMTVVAIADKDGCVSNDDGLDIEQMLLLDVGSSVLDAPLQCHRADRGELFRRPAGTLILAATEDAVSPHWASRLVADTVVVGANLGVSDRSLSILASRGRFVIPDFVGGSGGSASMEALFGPAHTPSPAELLDTTAAMMIRLIDDLVEQARSYSTSISEAAVARVRAAVPMGAAALPYGHSPLRDGSAMAADRVVEVKG